MSRALSRAAVAAVLASMALVLTGGTVAALDAPPLTIGGITIDGSAAVLTGSIADVDAGLVVNGVPVAVDESGNFVAKVHLGVGDEVILSFAGADGEAIQIRVPLDALRDTGGQGILDELLGAGVQIHLPDDGFEIVDGQMPVVEGRVLNEDNLAAFEVNGVDVLRVLGPDGGFSIALPGSSGSPQNVTFVATDRSGVSQTSMFTTTRVTSTIATRAGTTVSAAGAQRLVIAKVRLDKRFLKSAKYLGVVVTVKDRRGYLVRGAALRMRALPSKHVANGALRAGFTNRIGKAQFSYRLRPGALKGALPKYLTLATRASTPRASATKRVTLRLPIASVR